MKPIQIVNGNFKPEVLDSELPVLVDFYASWCGPCKAIAPTIEELAEEYDGKIKVVKVNTDDHEALAQEYGVASIPTLLVFRGGSVAHTLSIGLKSKSELKKELETYLDGATAQ